MSHQECGFQCCELPAEFHVRARGDERNSCYAFSCETHRRHIVELLLVHLHRKQGDSKVTVGRHEVGPDCGLPEAIWDEGLQTCVVGDDWLRADAVLGPVESPLQRVAQATRAAAVSWKKYREWLAG